MRQVVGAAILRDGRVLAARRTTPPEAAGRWEFPGGKVEPGETPDHALVREIREELGCVVAVTGWLPGAAAIGTTHELTVALAVLHAGAPAPVEHDEVRWLSVTELAEVDWLEPDRPFLGPLARAMMGGVRAIFFDEDGARAVAARLAGDGFEATVTRERLAGEDDDEDHPWAVLTDAPSFLLELLVDEHDGWLDDEAPAPPPVPPLDLPTAPERVKRS